MIQVRHVPDEVHRRLKARAAMQGRSLSEMILQELVHLAEAASFDEIETRLAGLPPVEVPGGAAETIRRERADR